MAQDYFTILTLLGKAKVADAIANGTDINLSEIAVGDGDYTPSEGQTGLVNEVHRAAANQIVRDTENTNWIIAELVIPSETGGWNVREVGIFDAAGDLFAIGKYPETYKPTFEAGSSKELVIRIILEISNQAEVTLSVDPTVVTATREYVDDQLSDAVSSVQAYVQGQIGVHEEASGAHDAENIDYDNSTSGLEATDVQAAIDEVSAGADLALQWLVGGASKIGNQAIRVRPFNVRSSDNAYSIFSSGNLDIDLTTNGALGLDTGSLAANTHYFIHAIINPTTNTKSVIASLNPGAPALPSGYTNYRLLYSFVTDGSLYVRESSICEAGPNGDFIGGWAGFQNIQANDVGGGAVTASVWNTYPFNTQFYNVPGGYLSATGRMALPKGLWDLEGWIEVYYIDYYLVGLYNYTTSQFIRLISSGKVDSQSTHEIPIRLNEPFLLTAASELEIRINPSQVASTPSYSFGHPATHAAVSGNSEYYGSVRFTKVGP